MSILNHCSRCGEILYAHTHICGELVVTDPEIMDLFERAWRQPTTNEPTVVIVIPEFIERTIFERKMPK